MTVPAERAVSAESRKGRPRSFDREAALHQALEVFWLHGYESTTIAQLCDALRIKPPSLYAAFGNKAALFMEAVRYYEDVYWGELWANLHIKKGTREAIAEFFDRAAAVLSSQDAPCGCLVTLSDPTDSSASLDLKAELRALRQETYDHFLRRLKAGVVAGDLDKKANTASLAYLFATLLHGMSIQARDGASLSELSRAGRSMLHVLPSSKQR